jgi:nucleoside-diphosphate kinase
MVKQLVKMSPEELEQAYHERTLVLCKPDALRLGLHGEILKRISRLFYKTVLVRMFRFDRDTIMDFYAPVIDMWEPREEIIEIFMKMTQAPCLAVVVEGPNAILAMRKLAGGAPQYKLEGEKVELTGYKAQFQPLLAQMGTVRGDFSAMDIPLPDTELIPVPNFIHATENEDDYEREIRVLTEHGHIQEADFFAYAKPEWDVIFGEGRGKLK